MMKQCLAAAMILGLLTNPAIGASLELTLNATNQVVQIGSTPVFHLTIRNVSDDDQLVLKTKYYSCLYFARLSQGTNRISLSQGICDPPILDKDAAYERLESQQAAAIKLDHQLFQDFSLLQPGKYTVTIRADSWLLKNNSDRFESNALEIEFIR